MSGNYVQRGAPAVYDKFTRARQALLSGADLAVELPAVFSSASAEYFARGAIGILNASGIIDSLCFGAETNDIVQLKQTAAIPLDENIRKRLSDGVSYAKAAGITRGLSPLEPNNILGAEYLRSLEQSNSTIKPYLIERKKAGHNDSEIYSGVASGKAIRKQILQGALYKIEDTLPKSAYESYKKQTPHHFDKMSPLLQYILKTTDKNEIGNIADITEGLENRIISSASGNFLISDIVSDVKTKRYTLARINRAVLHIILRITKDDFELCKKISPAYIRVLGFRKNSCVLRQLSQHSSVPVITNLKQAERLLDAQALALLEKEIVTSDIYYLTNGIARAKKYDYHEPVIII